MRKKATRESLAERVVHSKALTVDKVRPTTREEGSVTWTRSGLATYQAELDTLRAVSTVPPKTTSLTPSMTDEPPAPPTRGCTSDLRASMTVRVYLRQRTIQCCDAERNKWDGRGRGESERIREG